MAREEISHIKGYSDLIEISKRDEVSKIHIDFKLMTNVIMGKDFFEKRYGVKEEIEFLAGLSKIKSILEKYDFSFLILEKGEISFRRMQNYRPRSN